MDDASIRVSDDEREQAVISLRDHLLAGRLTLDEFAERVEAALQARQRGDLARVQEDLPGPAPEAARSRRKPARFTGALFGYVARGGRLRRASGRWPPARSATSTSICAKPPSTCRAPR